jgi:YD repeat-containing protein
MTIKQLLVSMLGVTALVSMVMLSMPYAKDLHADLPLDYFRPHTKEIDGPNGKVTITTQSLPGGRFVETTSYDGKVITYTRYVDGTSSQTYTDPKTGIQDTKWFDRQGRLHEEDTNYPDGSTDTAYYIPQTGQKWEETYKNKDGSTYTAVYENGQISHEWYTDASGSVVEDKKYDDRGHLVQDTKYFPDGSYVVAKYDAQGNLVSVTKWETGGHLTVLCDNIPDCAFLRAESGGQYFGQSQPGAGSVSPNLKDTPQVLQGSSSPGPFVLSPRGTNSGNANSPTQAATKIVDKSQAPNTDSSGGGSGSAKIENKPNGQDSGSSAIPPGVTYQRGGTSTRKLQTEIFPKIKETVHEQNLINGGKEKLSVGNPGVITGQNSGSGGSAKLKLQNEILHHISDKPMVQDWSSVAGRSAVTGQIQHKRRK